MNGKDHTELVFSAHQNSFQAGNGSALNPYPPPDFELGMGFRMQVPGQPITESFDFNIGERCGFAIEIDELHYSGQLQHL